MSEATHVVAVVGGATAGAEVAARLAEKGVTVVVLEQNLRPFGKIEDGLPRWHVGLRNKEYNTISTKLQLPNVHFVPNTRLGRDIQLDELAREWGFSAVVLASGAWRDRPLPVKDAERFEGKGLVYQNPFIIWFNHLGDPTYNGPTFTVADGVAVVGGGLASIDVMKLLMLVMVERKLKERGIAVPHLEELEQKGITETMASHGLTLADLGLRGATLYYRRRIEDMPLAEVPAGATEEKRTKVEATRRKMVDKATDKFGFKVEPLCAPDTLLVEDGQLVGLRLRRQRWEAGKLIPTDETVEHRAPFIVSSIGSIPEPLPGLAMKGDVLDVTDATSGKVPGFDNVFSTGNVVTGKGNIVASRRHATAVGNLLVESYLGLGDAEAKQALTQGAQDSGTKTAAQVAAHVASLPAPGAEKVAEILKRVAARQKAVGYTDFASWMAAHPPPPDDAGH